jgi:hypothetical protein
MTSHATSAQIQKAVCWKILINKLFFCHPYLSSIIIYNIKKSVYLKFFLENVVSSRTITFLSVPHDVRKKLRLKLDRTEHFDYFAIKLLGEQIKK